MQRRFIWAFKMWNRFWKIFAQLKAGRGCVRWPPVNPRLVLSLLRFTLESHVVADVLHCFCYYEKRFPRCASSASFDAFRSRYFHARKERIPQLIQVLGSQPAGDRSPKPGDKLTRSAVIPFSAARLHHFGRYQIILLGERGSWVCSAQLAYSRYAAVTPVWFSHPRGQTCQSLFSPSLTFKIQYERQPFNHSSILSSA